MEIDLGVMVPQPYRDFMLDNASELASLTVPLTYLDSPEANVDSYCDA